MKTKRLKDYLATRMDAKKISELEEQAKLESQYFELLQKEISEAILDYMAQKKIGLNELVRQLSLSTSHVIKIQKGEANLTLASLARIAAVIKKEPHILLKSIKK